MYADVMFRSLVIQSSIEPHYVALYYKLLPSTSLYRKKSQGVSLGYREVIHRYHVFQPTCQEMLLQPLLYINGKVKGVPSYLK